MNEEGAVKLTLPPGWQPLRGWVLLIAVMFVLNAAAYIAVTRPLWFSVTAQSRALEAGRQARLLLEPALAEARTNYGLVLQAETDLDELHRRIAASATSLGTVIGSLEERLQAVGMRFDRGTYAQERIDELDLQLLQMVVPLSGRYSAVRELVESLAASDEFIAIDQVGLMSSEQGGSGSSLRAELQLVAFLPATVEGPVAEPVAAEESEAEPVAGEGSVGEPVAAEESVAAEGPEDPEGRAEAEAGQPGTEESTATEAEETVAGTGDEASDPPTGPPSSEAREQTAQSQTRAASSISPVQRASELQARLASLPPLPYPPEAYDVRLADLDADRNVSPAQARNLFDFVRPAPPPVQAQPERQAGARPRPGGAGGRRRGQGEEAPAASTSPAIPLRLLGIVRVGQIRYASLTDGTELHVAAEGSSLPGGYQIVEVGIDYAEIKSGEQQVRLTLES